MKNGNIEFEKYLDMEHEYYILVPTTEEALDKLYDAHFRDESGAVCPAFEYMLFDEEKYLLMEAYLFNFLCAECDLLINMYEEEWAEPDSLGKVLELTDRMMENSDNAEFAELAKQFRKLVSKAIELNMPVVFFF